MTTDARPVTDADCLLGATTDTRHAAPAVTDGHSGASGTIPSRNVGPSFPDYLRAALSTPEARADFERGCEWDRARADFVRVARTREWRANRDAATCGHCGRALAASEPVWWIRAHGSHSGNALTVTCAACAPDWWKARSRQGACETCGRAVGMARRWSHHVFCSARCRWRWGNARHAAPRVTVTCAVCGRAFVPPRRDAKACSPACRQRAYRQREAQADAPEVTG